MLNRQSISRKSKALSIEWTTIVVIGLAVFISAALITFNQLDASPYNNVKETVHNACGWVGAQVAVHLFRLFGLAAFVAPIALLVYAIQNALEPVYERNWSKHIVQLAGWSLIVVSVTVLLAIQVQTIQWGGGAILIGGTTGQWIAQALERALKPLGSSLLAIVVGLSALTWITPWSIAQAFARGFQAVGLALWKTLRWSGRATLAIGALSWKKTALKASSLYTQWKSDDVSALPTNTQPLLSSPVIPQSVVPQPMAPQTVAPFEMSHDIQILERTLKEPENHAPAKLPPAASSMSKHTHWKRPTTEFLVKPPLIESSIDREKLVRNSQLLVQKLADFGIDGEITAVRPGPVITLYEFRPGAGIKVSRIAALADDLSMALSADSVRILAPLPGKSVVGIEIPSDNREKVYLREFLQHDQFFSNRIDIPIVMGKDIGGEVHFSDLARMPHLLCAGQTGSGKSVFMNALICSLLYRFTPDELRMILIDPKFIEFRAYQDTPHLLLPVVDDPKQASTALKWAVREMDRRYRILAMMSCRNLQSYNQKVEEMGTDVVYDLLCSESSSTTGSNDWLGAFETDDKGAPKVGKLPTIVLIIDELADLMMIARKDVEISVARIAQKARAAGIHLVVATQRPSTDVITGLIKANLPSRLSFQLASQVDSKTILDRSGAERLLGQGDMLFIPPGGAQPIRLHGPFVSDDEIHKITSFLKAQGAPVYREEILVDDDEDDGESMEPSADDPLWNDALELVQRTGHASASFLQRHFKIGYNRAARMIESMESKGIVGPADGARPREVLARGEMLR